MNLMSKNNDRIINEIVQLMQTDESFDALPSAIRWSKNIFRTRAVEPKKSIIDRVLAVLQIDLPAQTAAYGERSAASAQARQMLFQAGEMALDMRISKTAQGFNLDGQILGSDVAGGTVKLGEFEAPLNELGEFNFVAVPVGNYNLHLQISEKEIIVENLELK